MWIKGELVGVLFDAGGRNSHVTVSGARKAPSQLSEEPKFSFSRVLIHLTKSASAENNIDPSLKDDRNAKNILNPCYYCRVKLYLFMYFFFYANQQF